jgi:hypothetical protein
MSGEEKEEEEEEEEEEKESECGQEKKERADKRRCPGTLSACLP